MFLRPWNFPGKGTDVGCHFLLQEICLTQGLNPGLPHCKQTLYHLSHQGSRYSVTTGVMSRMNSNTTTSITEIEEELKSLLMKVKEQVKRLA